MRLWPVEVRCEDRRPVGFRWRRSWYRITTVQEVWRDTGDWWEGEEPRWFWRVAAGSGWFELAADGQATRWWLYRVYD
jgi:hypothetical protein